MKNSALSHNSPMAFRVLILEDDTFTRISVGAAVRHFGYQVVVEEATAGIALKKATVERPDVAVMDLHLGNGPTGLDVAIELRKRNPKIGLVFLTSYDDPRLLGPSTPEIPVGTVYLIKSDLKNLSAMKDAIELCVNKPKASQSARLDNPMASLTDSQVETLRLIAKGLSNSEIAKRKFVKERSVAVSISRIARQLGLQYLGNQNLRVNLAREYFKAIGANEIATEN